MSDVTCSNCGAKVYPRNIFCPQCGRSIGSKNVPPGQSQTHTQHAQLAEEIVFKQSYFGRSADGLVLILFALPILGGSIVIFADSDPNVLLAMFLLVIGTALAATGVIYLSHPRCWLIQVSGQITSVFSVFSKHHGAIIQGYDSEPPRRKIEIKGKTIDVNEATYNRLHTGDDVTVSLWGWFGLQSQSEVVRIIRRGSVNKERRV